MTASEHDEYSARLDGGAQFPPVLAEWLGAMTAQFPGHILRRVVAWLIKNKDKDILKKKGGGGGKLSEWIF